MAKLPSSSSFGLHFLRRLLCAHSATGNADTAQRDAPGHMSAPPEEPEGRSPCIVARLMGLDAMPPSADTSPAPQRQMLRRSRSASSADWGRSPPCGEDAPAAAVPASLSLREKPAYLRAENDMFLLLSFSPEERDVTEKKKADEEGGHENRPVGGDKKQRRERRRKLQFGDGDEEGDSGRGRECNAQSSSSPVSVLEARDVHEESSTTTSSSLEDVEPCSATSEEAHFASDQLDDMSHSRCSGRDKVNRKLVNKSDVSASDVSGIWKPVCILVEEYLKSMEWLGRDCANFVSEMDSGILDQLICEATVELVKLSSDAAAASHRLCPNNIQARRPSDWRHVQETFRQDKG